MSMMGGSVDDELWQHLGVVTAEQGTIQHSSIWF